MSDSGRLQRLLSSFEQRQAIAIIEKNTECSYASLLEGIAAWQSRLDEQGIDRHHVVGIKSDFHFDAITLFLSLLANGHTVALLPPATSSVVE